MDGPAHIPLADGVIDLAGGEIRRGADVSELGALEVRFLGYLAAKPGALVSVDELHREVWGFAPRVRSRAAYFLVRSLRPRLEVDPQRPTVLVGTEGRGFGLLPAVEVAEEDLVGRADQVRALLGMTARPGALVSLTGPGGIGKSRLLAELARALRGVHPVVDADGVRSPADLAVAVGRTWMIEVSGPDPAARLGAVLEAHPDRLVVVDHLDDWTPALIDALLAWRARAPGLRVVVATRAPLPLRGAQLVLVPPLGRDDARALFRRRAAAGFHGSEAELDELLGLLDGVPLAIELAAARARSLPLYRLVDELQRDLATLSGSAADVSAWQHSLSASIARSWTRLDPSGQRALARLSAIPLPLPVGAAVAAAGELDAVSRLVEHGLVVAEPGPVTVFRVPHAVRLFAGRDAAPEARVAVARWWLEDIEGAGRMGSGEAGVVRPRLADLAMAVLDDADPDTAGSLAACVLELGRQVGVREVHDELWERSRDLRLSEAVAARLRWAWATIELIRSSPGPEKMESAFEALRRIGPPARVLTAAVTLARERSEVGDAAGAMAAIDIAASVAESRTDHALVAVERAFVLRGAGRLPEALEAAEEALTLATRARHDGLRARAMGGVAVVLADFGRHDEAVEVVMPALAMADSPRARAVALYRVGLALGHAGRFEEARALLQEGIALADVLGDPRVNSLFTINLALLEMRAGRPEQALPLLRRAIARAAEGAADSPDRMRLLLELARLRAGESPAPEDVTAAVRATFPMTVPDEAAFLAWCAEVDARSGRSERAWEVLAEAELRRARGGYSARSECVLAIEAVKALLH